MLKIYIKIKFVYLILDISFRYNSALSWPILVKLYIYFADNDEEISKMPG